MADEYDIAGLKQSALELLDVADDLPEPVAAMYRRLIEIAAVAIDEHHHSADREAINAAWRRAARLTVELKDTSTWPEAAAQAASREAIEQMLMKN